MDLVAAVFAGLLLMEPVYTMTANVIEGILETGVPANDQT